MKRYVDSGYGDRDGEMLAAQWQACIDFDSLDDDAVTIRERDSMAQERVPIAGLSQALATRLEA